MELSKSLEDYLESIYLIMLENDVVRLKKLASTMHVSAPSALGAVNNLKKAGMVNHEKYGYIRLTDKGEQRARDIFYKHRIIFKFLNEILGLDEKKADDEACQLEHHLSDETTDRFVKFIRYLKSCPIRSEHGFERFHDYYDNTIDETKTESVSPATGALSEFKEGTIGVITKISGKINQRRKLIKMGVLPKLSFEITGVTEKYMSLSFSDFTTEIERSLCNNILIEVVE